MKTLLSDSNCEHWYSWTYFVHILVLSTYCTFWVFSSFFPFLTFIRLIKHLGVFFSFCNLQFIYYLISSLVVFTFRFFFFQQKNILFSMMCDCYLITNLPSPFLLVLPLILTNYNHTDIFSLWKIKHYKFDAVPLWLLPNLCPLPGGNDFIKFET